VLFIIKGRKEAGSGLKHTTMPATHWTKNLRSHMSPDDFQPLKQVDLEKRPFRDESGHLGVAADDASNPKNWSIARK
jgi:hypothetical protein